MTRIDEMLPKNFGRRICKFRQDNFRYTILLQYLVLSVCKIENGL